MVTETKKFKKTRRMELEEARLGKPLAVILPEKYAELGSIRAVGKALEIDQNTVYYWMKLMGFSFNKLEVKKGK
jgi:hypothetical protein